jgi:short-subunit dehydrogenase
MERRKKRNAGATNGIGRETARVLARRGAEVIIPARTMESGNAVKQSIAEEVPGSRLHVMEMDLASLDSVRRFATAFDSSHTHLNILMYATLTHSLTHMIAVCKMFRR